jgi:hypothetical protein
MHEYQLEEMVETLIEAKLLDADFHTPAVEALRGYWSDKIADSWAIDDVLDLAKEHGHTLTDDEARQVLQITQSRKDASIGINWDVILTHLEGFVADRIRGGA